jgi:hypothetical protein
VLFANHRRVRHRKQAWTYRRLPIVYGRSYEMIAFSSDTKVPVMIASGVSGDQNAPIMLNRESRRMFLSAIPPLYRLNKPMTGPARSRAAGRLLK